MDHSPSKKTLRQQRISQLIHQHCITSQEQLAELLAGEGFRAAQTTLSRDLAELNVFKGAAGYRLDTEEPDDKKHRKVRLHTTVREYVESAVQAMNLVVLRTGPGHASPVGLALDEDAPAEVTGNIAGDDTIFVATPSVEAARLLTAKFNRMISS